MRRTQYQGAQPAPLEFPESEDSRPLRLRRGQSWFRLPLEARYLFSAGFMGTQASRDSTNESLGCDRCWPVIKIQGGMSRSGSSNPETAMNRSDVILSISQAPAALLRQSGEEEEESGGCPPTWVFRSGLRVVVLPPNYAPDEDGRCPGCVNVLTDATAYIQRIGELYAGRLMATQGISHDVPAVREFPVYGHVRGGCPFGLYPPIRHHYFFGQGAERTRRGRHGWCVQFDAHFALVVPSQYTERFWTVKFAIDCVLPLDASLHAWLGGFIRMHGLLRLQGGRFNRRATVVAEWESSVRGHGWVAHPHFHTVVELANQKHSGTTP